MDGTLVDTEPYWIETEFDLAAEYGGTWSRELALELVGNDLITSGRFIRKHMGIDLTPEEIVERLLDGVVARVRSEVPWRPGARELLEQLREAGVRARSSPCRTSGSWRRSWPTCRPGRFVPWSPETTSPTASPIRSPT